MRLVLMGMPGVGKGTQAARLRARLGVVHVSTGDMLREAVRSGSDLGKTVQGYLDRGDLVPDELIGELIVDRLGRPDAGAGFILDGFPRTAAQVEILDGALERLGVSLDAVCLLEASEDEVVRRLSGRRVCPGCQAVYHIESQPPASAGVCDECGSALVQRKDDSESVIRDRLEVYRTQTQPVADVYGSRGVIKQIDAVGDPDDVFERIAGILERA